MKIEQLVVQHFFNAKEVTLQGMGTFKLSPDFIMPSEKDKDYQIPDNSISFQYNTRATEDDALINFIVQQTRKMKSLASADLDSYLVLGKQFLNIGKPFKIEGLGFLVLNQQGEYEFTQGHHFNTKNEEPTALVKEKTEDEVSFSSEPQKTSGGSKKGLLIASIIVLLGLTGVAAWYFFMRNTNTGAAETTEQQPIANTSIDTNKTVTPPAITDSSALVKKDSIPATLPATAQTYTFKVVFRVLTLGGALKKKEELNKPYVVMYTSDSIHYKLAEVFNRPLSDTTKVKDSLRVFYDFNTFIEYK